MSRRPDSVRRPWGVGFLGAGAVVQAIHVPTLARLGDRFRVARVMDPDSDLAASVARAAGAGAGAATEEELLTDPEVEIVAVCSPPAVHARQILAAIDAGKRAVLCEKPLAVSRAEARLIARASRSSGVPVIVGAMHLHDPAVAAAEPELTALAGRADLVHSRIVLPLNETFEDAAAEVRRPVVHPAVRPAPSTRLRQLLLGLAIHDLPLVRALLTDEAQLEIVHAQLLDPVGFLVVAETPRTTIVLEGSMRPAWRPEWTLEAVAAETSLVLEFTPSYVHAGSGAVRRRAGASTSRVDPEDENGYVGEWLRIDELARHPSFDRLDPMVDDLSFALDVADRAERFLLGQEGT